MPKKARFPQSRHHIMCYDVVWEYFESRFGPSGVQPIGVSTVIRELLYKQYLTWAEAENNSVTDKPVERTRPGAPITSI